jgi:hypothetical protein
MGSDVAAATGPELTRPVLFKIQAWNQGVASMTDDRCVAFPAQIFDRPAVTLGLAKNSC